MGKVTSKRQVTIPKAIADRFGIEPGDDLEWVPAGDSIRVVPETSAARRPAGLTVAQRLELFDRATERQRDRQRGRSVGEPPRDRGWTREDLYRRGRAD